MKLLLPNPTPARRLGLGPALGLVLGLALPGGASAQDDELDSGRVIAVEDRPYRMAHEFSAFAGILPLDAVYTGYSLGGSYTLHFDELWAWEAIDFHYSANVDSGLDKTLAERWSVAPTGTERIQYLATSHLIVSPLFGKLALFNSAILYAETYLAVGGGITHFDDGFRPALSAGPGVRLYFGPRVSARLDVRSALVPDIPSGLEHVLRVTLGVSFNFGAVARGAQGHPGEPPGQDGEDNGAEELDPFQKLDELYPASAPAREGS